jgi:hypothetical protein
MRLTTHFLSKRIEFRRVLWDVDLAKQFTAGLSISCEFGVGNVTSDVAKSMVYGSRVRSIRLGIACLICHDSYREFVVVTA